MVLGVLNNVIPFSVLVWGQTHMSASLASILNATMPLFTVILAHYFTLDEKITPNKLVGVLIGIGGVAVIVGENGIDFSSGSNFAKIAILGAPLSYAVAALIARRFARWNLSPLFVAFGQSAAAAVVALPLTTLVKTLGHQRVRARMGVFDCARSFLFVGRLSDLLPPDCNSGRDQYVANHAYHSTVCCGVRGALTR